MFHLKIYPIRLATLKQTVLFVISKIILELLMETIYIFPAKAKSNLTQIEPVLQELPK